MQQQQKQSILLHHRGMLNLKRLHLQDLHRQVKIQQIVVNSMLVVASTRDFSSTLMVGKLAAPYSLMRLDLEILTVGVPAAPALLRSSTRMATFGQPGLHQRPTVAIWASVRAAWARRVRAVVRTASPFAR